MGLVQCTCEELGYTGTRPGECGSCVAFAVTGTVESHLMIEKNDPSIGNSLDLSEASLFFSANRECLVGSPNYGWFIPEALDLLVNEGICEERYYPYTPVDQEAKFVIGTERTYKITGYDSTSKIDQMKRWIVEEGPSVEVSDGYLLTDGNLKIQLLDNKEDAHNALRVARRYTYLGFIGRENNRRNRYDYITQYWGGNSGLP
jgi:hypothetical protein